MKMRNLPHSFFQPSSVRRHSPAPTASHSREGSADSSYGSRGGPGPIRVSGTMSPQPPTPMHFRHHSSPATLQQNFAVAQQPSPLVRHTRQHSYDALADDYVPLPDGWEQATTTEGQVYYLNHNTQTTTWEDPRKKTPASPAPKAAPSALQPPAVSTAAPRPPPSSLPLPDGWEQALTPAGDTYFINHKDKTTSWVDPRIPPHLHPSPLPKGQQLSLQVNSTPIGSPTQMSPHHGARSPAPMRHSPDARRKAPNTAPLATPLNNNSLPNTLTSVNNNNSLNTAQPAIASSIISNNNLSPHHQQLLQQQRQQQLNPQQQQQITPVQQQQQISSQQQQLTTQQQQLNTQQQQQQQLTPQQQQQINTQQQQLNQQQQQLSQQQQQITQQLSQQQIQQQVAYRTGHGRQDSSDSGVGLVTGLKGISITGPERRSEAPAAPSLMETADGESVMDSDDLMPTISLPNDFLVSQIMGSDRMDDDEWL